MAYNMTATAALYDRALNGSIGVEPYQQTNHVISTNTDIDIIVEQPKLPDCMFFKFFLYTVSMGLLCILGFIGNTVSFLVLRRDCSTPIASFLLQALAIADNAFLVLWMVHYSLRELIRFIDEDALKHPSWMYLRVYSFPVLFMAQTQTIWLTVVIAINRFMAVCLPYKAPHLCTVANVCKECIVVSIFSFIYNLPRFFELKIVTTQTPVKNLNLTNTDKIVTETKWASTELRNNNTYRYIYTDCMYYLFSFIFPLLLLTYVNTRVITAYRASRKRKRRMTSRRADNENNITLVMIIVVLVFMFCQAPARIVQIVWSYNYIHCKQYQFYLIHISNTFEVLNSSINFAVYFVFRRRFRAIFWTSICIPPFVSHSGGRGAIGGAGADSQRMTTTEGLSLAQFEQSTMIDPLGGSFSIQPAANIPPSLEDRQKRRSHNSNIYRELSSTDNNKNKEQTFPNAPSTITQNGASLNDHHIVGDTKAVLHENEVQTM